MDLKRELQNKKKELKEIKTVIEETLIISQIKYSEYLREQNALENEIKQLEDNINKPKIQKTWIELEDGWKQRVYKDE